MKRKTKQQNLQHLTIAERHQVKQQFFRLYKKSGNVAASARALDICNRTATRWVHVYKSKGKRVRTEAGASPPPTRRSWSARCASTWRQPRPTPKRCATSFKNHASDTPPIKDMLCCRSNNFSARAHARALRNERAGSGGGWEAGLSQYLMERPKGPRPARCRPRAGGVRRGGISGSPQCRGLCILHTCNSRNTPGYVSNTLISDVIWHPVREERLPLTPGSCSQPRTRPYSRPGWWHASPLRQTPGRG